MIRIGFWIAIVITIALLKPLIDCEIEIAHRFLYRNRCAIFRSVGTWELETGFFSLIVWEMVLCRNHS